MPIIQPTSQTQPFAQAQLKLVEEAQVAEEPGTAEEPPSNANDQQNDPHVTSNADGIVADPGLRIPIEQMDPNIRGAVRRAYFSRSLYQPKGHSYPKRKICEPSYIIS